MTNARFYRKKIKTAKNIAKITKAMQMVAVSKMKRAQDAARASRDYSLGLSAFSKLLSTKLESTYHPLLSKVNEGAAGDLVVFIGSEKGLCGSMLTNLAKKLLSQYPDLNSDKVRFISVANKAKGILTKFGGTIIADLEMGLSGPKYDSVVPIAKIIREEFLKGSVKNVKIVYTKFVSTMRQEATIDTLLPLRQETVEQHETPGDDFTLFEPSAKAIINSLMDMYLETVIYQYLIEAYASEQSARMVAMKNATDNANSMISNLTVVYNNARQASITAEIIDIGSAAALSVQA